MTLWLDLILAGMAAEAVLLAWFHRRTGRGVAPAALLPSLGAGAALFLGMRIALGGAWWGWVSACLLAGLAAHVTDLRLRWGTKGVNRPPGVR